MESPATKQVQVTPQKPIILATFNPAVLQKIALTNAITLSTFKKPSTEIGESQIQDRNESRQCNKADPPPLQPLQLSAIAANCSKTSTTTAKDIKNMLGLANISIVKTMSGSNREKTQELVLVGKLIKDLGSHSIEFNQETLKIVKEFTLGIQLMHTNKIRSLETHVECLQRECKDKSERISALEDTLNETTLNLYDLEEEKKLSGLTIYPNSNGLDGWLDNVNSLGSKFLADIEQSCKSFLNKHLENLKTAGVCEREVMQPVGNTQQAEETIGSLITKLLNQMDCTDVSSKHKYQEQLNNLFEKLQPMIDNSLYMVSDAAINRMPENNVNSSNPLVKDVNMGVELDIPRVQMQNHCTNNTVAQSGKYVVHDFTRYLLNCLCERPDSGVQLHQDVLMNNLQEVKKQCIAFRFLMHSIDVHDGKYQTPMHLALISDADPEVFCTLLTNRADLTLVDCDGNNSLHLAVQCDTLRKLLHPSVRPLIHESIFAKMSNVLNGEGYAPLHLAAMNGKPEHVEQLLKMRANINLTDKKSGRTALHHAVERNEVEIASILKKYNADIFVKTYAGLTIIDNLVDNETDFSDEMKKLFYADRITINAIRKTCPTTQEIKRVHRKKLQLARVAEAKKRKIV